MGRAEDIQLALRRREQRGTKNKTKQRSESLGGPVGAWQILDERQPENSVEEGTQRLV